MQVRLQADGSALMQALLDFESLLELGGSLVDLGEFPVELASIQVESVAASGARDLLVRFEPSDGLLVHLAAARARNADVSFVE